MRNIKLIVIMFSVFYGMESFSSAPEPLSDFRYPIYVGITGGYGATTWEGLVPIKKNQSGAMIMSTPVSVTEGGAVWGVFAGYEFIPYFALEGSYMRYPNAKVSFDEFSIYTFDHDGDTELSTHTETVSLMGKIMLIIPTTRVRAYSSAGVAGSHRWDAISDRWRVTPTFGIGFNYPLTPHIMSEVGASYTAGYGTSELNPAENYMPFLYSVFLRFAYRF
jgi:hypothetical protein